MGGLLCGIICFFDKTLSVYPNGFSPWSPSLPPLPLSFPPGFSSPSGTISAPVTNRMMPDCFIMFFNRCPGTKISFCRYTTSAVTDFASS